MKGRPLRVVHVITDLDVGGAEAMLARLLPRLSAAGIHSVVVCLTPPGPIAATIRAQGTEVVTLNLRPGRPNPLRLIRLCAILRRLRPDVTQTWLYHADMAGLIASAVARVPNVVWNIRCAELDPRDHPRSLMLLIRGLALVSGWPAVVVANSGAGRRAHEQIGYAPKRWEIIPNGFDTERFKPSPDARAAWRARLAIPEGAMLVGLLARYHPMKDHASFLRAARRVVEQRNDVHFAAAGRGVAGNPVLENLLRDLRLEGRMHLIGESDDAAGFLAALDVAVSSSYSEAFPNVIGEAMACGTPCVVTDVGESANIVGATGVVVPPRDPESLAAAILRQAGMSAVQRLEAGAAARDRIIREYSLDSAADRYIRLYETLTSAADRRESTQCVA